MANEPSSHYWRRLLEWHRRPIKVEIATTHSHEGALRFQAISDFCARNFDLALVKFDELAGLTRDPKDESWRALTLYVLGRYAEACGVYESLLQGHPANAKFLNYLAHIKCTCELDELRDGARAVELATRLCEISEWKDWAHISVLAASYAEIGDWEQAERFGTLAVEQAPSAEKDRRKIRLEQYRQHRPFRSSPEMNISLLVPN